MKEQLEKETEKADLWINNSPVLTPRLIKLFKEAEIPINVHLSGCDVPVLDYRGRFTQGYGAIECLLRTQIAYNKE